MKKKLFNKKTGLFVIGFLLLFALLMLLKSKLWAAPVPQIVLPKISIGEGVVKGPGAVALPLQILLLLTVLTLAPYILIMMTAFIRIAIVLSFVRAALGTQQVPPTQVLMGLALFLTLYVMMPVGHDINTKALQPFFEGKINQTQALEKTMHPIRDFMFNQTRAKDIKLFLKLGKLPLDVKEKKDVPTYVLMPAFVTSEIKTAFEIGFLIYLPFLIIDMVVASVLLSMGMFMLSPMAISLPFKLLLFVMIDGWNLLVNSLVKSFK